MRWTPKALLWILGMTTSVLDVTDFSVLQTQLSVTQEIRTNPYLHLPGYQRHDSYLAREIRGVDDFDAVWQWRNLLHAISQFLGCSRSLKACLKTFRLQFHWNPARRLANDCTAFRWLPQAATAKNIIQSLILYNSTAESSWFSPREDSMARLQFVLMVEDRHGTLLTRDVHSTNMGVWNGIRIPFRFHGIANSSEFHGIRFTRNWNLFSLTRESCFI